MDTAIITETRHGDWQVVGEETLYPTCADATSAVHSAEAALGEFVAIEYRTHTFDGQRQAKFCLDNRRK